MNSALFSFFQASLAGNQQQAKDHSLEEDRVSQSGHGSNSRNAQSSDDLIPIISYNSTPTRAATAAAAAAMAPKTPPKRAERFLPDSDPLTASPAPVASQPPNRPSPSPAKKLFLASLGRRTPNPNDPPSSLSDQGDGVPGAITDDDDDDDDAGSLSVSILLNSQPAGVSADSPEKSTAGSDSTDQGSLPVDPIQRLSQEFGLGTNGQTLPKAFFGEFSCWLMRNVLLKGHLYLLDTHICFYARVPHLNEKPLQHSGFMSKRNRIGVYSTYWFVLNGTNLSIYSDAKTSYYPVESIDLRSVSSIERYADQPTRLKLRFHDPSTTGQPLPTAVLSYQPASSSIDSNAIASTAGGLAASSSPVASSVPASRVPDPSGASSVTSTPAASSLGVPIPETHVSSSSWSSASWKIATDSLQSCNEWYQALQEACFRAQNANDDVRLVLPVANLVQIAATANDPAVRMVAQWVAAAGEELVLVGESGATGGETVVGEAGVELPGAGNSVLVEEEYTFAYFAAHGEVLSTLRERYPDVGDERRVLPQVVVIPHSTTTAPVVAVEGVLAEPGDGTNELRRMLSLRKFGDRLGGLFTKQHAHPARPLHVASQGPVAPGAEGVTGGELTVTSSPAPSGTSASAPVTPTADPAAGQPIFAPAVNLIRRISGHRRCESAHMPSTGSGPGSKPAVHPHALGSGQHSAPDSTVKLLATPSEPAAHPPAINRAGSAPGLVTQAQQHSQSSSPPLNPQAATTGSATRPPRVAHRKTSSLDLGRGRVLAGKGASQLGGSQAADASAVTPPAATSPTGSESSSSTSQVRPSSPPSPAAAADDLVRTKPSVLPNPSSPLTHSKHEQQQQPQPPAAVSALSNPMGSLKLLTRPSKSILPDLFLHPARTVRWGSAADLNAPTEIPGGDPTSIFPKLFHVEDTVVAWSPAYLLRTLSRFGHVYVGTKYLAFRSIGVLGIRTPCTCLVPLVDIAAVAMDSDQLSKHGLIVAARLGELCFEFPTPEACHAIQTSMSRPMRPASEVANPAKMVLYSSILHDLSMQRREEPHVNGELIRQDSPQGATTNAFCASSSSLPHQKPAPMRITILTIGTRGDVQPFIALAKGLQRDGHTVRLATHLEYKSWIQGFGIDFAEVKGEPAEIMQLCVDNPMFSIGFVRQVYGKFRGWIVDLLNSAWDACQDSDLIIEAAGALGAGYHIAEKLQIPVMRAFMMPWTRTSAFAHPFAPVKESAVVATTMGYNKSTFTLAEQAIWTGTRPMINRWRKNKLGLPALFSLDLSRVPFIYGISPSVMPPPPEWPSWVHVTGYWFLPPSPVTSQWMPPDPLAQFLAVDPSRTVYIGFGSIVVPDPDALSRTIQAAVKRAGVRAIVCRGWSARLADGSKKQVSSTACDAIMELDSVPHDWLFPRMRGVVHHGGSGTTAAGLRFGVPCIIKPFFGDQFFWASRVEELGAGIHLRRFTEDKFAEALIRLVADDKMLGRARMVGEKVKQEDGVTTAIHAVYRDLEQARQLIPKRTGSVVSGAWSGDITSLLWRTKSGSSPLTAHPASPSTTVRQDPLASSSTPTSSNVFVSVGARNARTVM